MSARCDQCGVTAPTALHHEDHGALCSLCAARQLERDEQRGLLTPGMHGWPLADDDADRWDG